MTPSPPPIPGMPLEMWAWLQESSAVRPDVVARVRAALDEGKRVSADDVALAILEGPYRDVA